MGSFYDILSALRHKWLAIVYQTGAYAAFTCRTYATEKRWFRFLRGNCAFFFFGFFTARLRLIVFSTCAYPSLVLLRPNVIPAVTTLPCSVAWAVGSLDSLLGNQGVFSPSLRDPWMLWYFLFRGLLLRDYSCYLVFVYVWRT